MRAIARDIEKGGGKGSAGKLLFETTLEMMGYQKLGSVTVAPRRPMKALRRSVQLR